MSPELLQLPEEKSLPLAGIPIRHPLKFMIPYRSMDSSSCGATAVFSKFCSAISLNGKVYVIGLLLSGANTDRIFAYDPASQISGEKSTDMPTARHAASLVFLDEKIWVLGGWSGVSPLVPTSKVEIYDPIANSWSNGPALDIAKAWTSAWLIDGEIHVAGGNDNQVR